MYTYVKQKAQQMQYTLITKKGKIMQFYVQAVAEMYQRQFGGVVFTQQVLEKELSKSVAQ